MSLIKSLLIVEDDSMTANLYQILLERAGYNVMTANDSDSATQVMMGVEVDLILLDYDLPDQMGLDWLTEIRTISDYYASVPVVLVSGINRDVDLSQDPYIWFMEKPLHPQQIVDAVAITISQFG